MWASTVMGQYESFSGRGPQDIQLRLELYIYISYQ